MFSEEWPLMTFTVLSQLAIGAFVILWFIHEMSTKSEWSIKPSVMKRGLLAVALVMGVSLIFSLFHLGTPTGAYRSIYNFTSSWLSREIIFAGGFFVLAVVDWYYYQKKQIFHRVLALLTSLIGLIAVYSMASLYSASVRPAWDNIYTYFTFFGTTLLMGIMGAIFIVSLSFKGQANMFQSIVKKCGILAVVIIIVQLVCLPFYISNLSNGGPASGLSLRLFTDHYAVLFAVKWILAIIGTIMLFFIMNGKKAQTMISNVLLLAFVLVFVGEFIGRYVFYGIGVSIGIG